MIAPRPAATRLEKIRALAPAGLLALLLGVLGFFQIHWLEQMREADRARSQISLDRDLRRFAAEFNGELARLFFRLQPSRRAQAPADREWAPLVEQRLADWRANAEFPDLVSHAYLVHTVSGGARAPRVRRTVERLALGPQAPGREESAAPPPSLEPLLRALADGGRRPRLLRAEMPALVVPLLVPPSSRRDGDAAPERRTRRAERNSGQGDGSAESEARRRPRRGLGQWPLLVLHLDRGVLLEELTPALVRRAFGPAPDFHLRLSDAAGEILATFGPDLGTGRRRGERGRPQGVDGTVEVFGPLAERAGRGPRPRHWSAIERLLDSGQWRLQATHPAGSLAAAVEASHRRNVALAFGILAVLAASTLLLLRGAARSQRLARQQLDFVAGITHELLTPLAALRSAGQNLADGVVDKPERIGRYGRMIDREAARLTALVEQVLAYSRMRSGPPALRLAAVEIEGEIEAVLGQLAATVETSKIDIETDLEAGLPAALADSGTLRRALLNLIHNAAKYGQPESGPGWIGVSARRRAGRRVEVTVRDRGPGIDPRDRPRVFEPFFRGQRLAASPIPGSGLGLALVRHWIEAQGGSVGVETSPAGSAFTITLRAADWARPTSEQEDAP
ncbi:MAG: HAMP domain-containing sensor histidine kinase [Acidobacteriota bacterium]